MVKTTNQVGKPESGSCASGLGGIEDLIRMTEKIREIGWWNWMNDVDGPAQYHIPRIH